MVASVARGVKLRKTRTGAKWQCFSHLPHVAFSRTSQSVSTVAVDASLVVQLLSTNIRMNDVTARRRLSTWMIGACGVWLVGLGAYFIVFRPPLLPEDVRFMGSTAAHIRTAIPDLERWAGKVFIVMGGFMAGAGVLTMFVAAVAMPRRLKGTSWVLAFTGACTVALMSVTNFALHSEFEWVLLGPALVWLGGLTLYSVDR